MKLSTTWIATVCLLAPFGFTGCGGAGSESGAAKPNVILIIGDTFRADRLTGPGQLQALTPYLDRMSVEGVRFEVARSHAPWTLPSTASLLTSLHPLEHGAGGRLPAITSLSEDASTIAARFKESGYDTHAIVNVHFLDPRTYGVTRDFASVDNVSFQSNVDVRPADVTTDAALAWLDQREDKDKPFFLMVHYFDPHCVYAPPEIQRREWAKPEDRLTDWTFGTRDEMVAIRNGDLVPDKATLQRAAALYNGEIAYLDGQIGRLDDGLRMRVSGDELITVFTSDHGEEFFDHEGFEHGHTLFEELVRVPLIIRAPGRLPASKRIGYAVRHIDVAPTLCELADIALDEQYVGESLVSLVTGDPESKEGRGTLAHGNFWAEPLTSWTKGGWKLIEVEGQAPRLYHVLKDARERSDVASSEPEKLAVMQAELAAVLEGMSALKNGEAVDLDAKMLEVHRALGYSGDDSDSDDKQD